MYVTTLTLIYICVKHINSTWRKNENKSVVPFRLQGCANATILLKGALCPISFMRPYKKKDSECCMFIEFLSPHDLNDSK